MCPLTIHFFNTLTRYKIYNITRYNGERSLLKSERKERSWLINSCRTYKEPLYIEVGDPS